MVGENVLPTLRSIDDFHRLNRCKRLLTAHDEEIWNTGVDRIYEIKRKLVQRSVLFRLFFFLVETKHKIFVVLEEQRTVVVVMVATQKARERERMDGRGEKIWTVSLIMNARKDFAFHLIIPFAGPVFGTEIFVEMLEITTNFLISLHLHATMIVHVVDPTSSKQWYNRFESLNFRSLCPRRLLCLIGIGKARIEWSTADAFFPILFQALSNATWKYRCPFIVDRHVFPCLEIKHRWMWRPYAGSITISKRSS